MDIRLQSPNASGKGLSWPHSLDEKLMKLERTTECFNKIVSDPKLELQLPKRGCLAGGVIKHAMDVFDKTSRLHSPMVYKFGYTHCPKYRFYNNKFGYAVDKHQRWQSMIILFASHETAGPSFLEAFLIEKFKGNSADVTLTIFVGNLCDLLVGNVQKWFLFLTSSSNVPLRNVRLPQ